MGGGRLDGRIQLNSTALNVGSFHITLSLETEFGI